MQEARRLLAWHLVSRDTSELSAAEVAGAAIESLAENLSDSVVAPLLAYRVGGLPPRLGRRQHHGHSPGPLYRGGVVGGQQVGPRQRPGRRDDDQVPPGRTRGAIPLQARADGGGKYGEGDRPSEEYAVFVGVKQ